MKSFSLFIIFISSVVWANDDRPLRTVKPPVTAQAGNAAGHASASSSQRLSALNTLINPATLEKQLTQRYIAQYTSRSGIEYLNASMERANIFMPFIMEEITKRNLPPELAYLPVIESSFVITARSRSGAVGLWQFMLNSVSPFDIRVTDMVDERRDFIKSTRGALQKLEENYNTLGNWELALAAYNAGLGAVTRITRRTGIRDYWELSRRGEFRQETEHYVPKLIAAAYVLSQPRRFGINVWHKSFEWAAIPLPQQVSIDIVAEEAGIDRDLLRRLNAELLHGISPADSNYHLIIPAAHHEQVSRILEQEELRLIRFYYHIVRQGDTLWSMSRHYGTPLNVIEQHNPGISSRYLRLGETVIIPAYKDIAPPPARTVTSQAFNGKHVVEKGESFWSLSRIYGVDPQTLAEANNMRLDQILHTGRTLRVPILE